jgi:transcriptional regulator with XRE-family HTH domain
MTGIAASSLSDYEEGKIVPQVHQLKKLCEAYKLDPMEVCSLIKYAPSDFNNGNGEKIILAI